MLAYQVMTEQEAIEERYNLLKEGEYDAVISASLDKVSLSSGNPMMDITLQVFDENGKARSVRDFLVFTPSMMWKVIHFADSAGLLKVYEEGKLCSNVVLDHRVKVKISVEQGGLIPEDKLKGGASGSRYPDKNKVDDYVKKSDQCDPVRKIDEIIEDDEIPF